MKEAALMRGCPGSGKSMRARRRLEEAVRAGLTSVIASADDYHMRDGVYAFDPRNLGRAHAECILKFKKALAEGVDLAIVDNTNIRVRDFEPYLRAAHAAGYTIVIDEVRPTSLEDLAAWHARCVHGVPWDKMVQMRDRWQDFDVSQWLANRKEKA